MKDILHRTAEIIPATRKNAPVTHCITNPVVTNDSANALLAVGAKPIMAEHPDEMPDIVRVADAELLNLGCINESKMKAMINAGTASLKKDIPVVLDLVGVSCSTLRRDFAKRLISEVKPKIIKGNYSEIYSVLGMNADSKGLESLTGLNEKAVEKLKCFAEKHNAVILATGKQDLIVSKDEIYICGNGTARLSLVTGTGCIVGALTAAYSACGDYTASALLAVSEMGICGELCENIRGLGSFRVGLIDALSEFESSALFDNIKIREI
ncbi:MAG: hydroxyethylthiazole kinase [Clostridia bacterium]|nr:hydroxyethylthiazole kinase [Clostridia bacterium]